MDRHLTRQSAFVALVPWIFVFLWSTGFIAAKFTVQYASPFQLLFLRGALSCMVFLLMAVVAGVKFPSPQGAIHQLKAGLLLHGVFLGGCFYAIHRGMPAAVVALVTGLQPVLTAVYVSVFNGYRLNLRKWAGVVVGFAGVLLVLSPGKHQFQMDLWALGSAMLGLFGVTAGTLYQKKAHNDGHILSATFFQYVSLTIPMGLLSLATETQATQWSPSFVLGLIWLVIGVSVTAILLLIFMIRSGQSTEVATYFYLVPVLTAIEAWALFGEAVNGATVLGMGVAIIGMLLVLRK